MSSARRIASLPIVGAALALIAFGVVRGASDAGPASGTRLSVAIEAPVDDAARKVAARVVEMRLDERGTTVRVVPMGDGLVVEVGERDPEMVGLMAKVLERTAMLEIRTVDAASNQPGPTLLLAGPAIRSARVDGPAVEIEVKGAGMLGTFRVGTPIAILLEGRVRHVGAPDRITGTFLHLPMSGNTDEGIAKAFELADAVLTGAVRPLRVTSKTEFTRATGFLPRAWPFLAIGGVLLLVGGWLLIRKGRR